MILYNWHFYERLLHGLHLNQYFTVLWYIIKYKNFYQCLFKMFSFTIYCLYFNSLESQTQRSYVNT